MKWLLNAWLLQHYALVVWMTTGVNRRRRKPEPHDKLIHLISYNQLRQLATEMVAYNVQSFGADSTGNVFISIRPNNFRSVDLLKMTSKAALDARYTEAEYACIQGEWYEFRDEE